MDDDDLPELGSIVISALGRGVMTGLERGQDDPISMMARPQPWFHRPRRTSAYRSKIAGAIYARGCRPRLKRSCPPRSRGAKLPAAIGQNEDAVLPGKALGSGEYAVVRATDPQDDVGVVVLRHRHRYPGRSYCPRYPPLPFSRDRCHRRGACRCRHHPFQYQRRHLPSWTSLPAPAVQAVVAIPRPFEGVVGRAADQRVVGRRRRARCPPAVTPPDDAVVRHRRRSAFRYPRRRRPACRWPSPPSSVTSTSWGDPGCNGRSCRYPSPPSAAIRFTPRSLKLGHRAIDVDVEKRVMATID